MRGLEKKHMGRGHQTHRRTCRLSDQLGPEGRVGENGGQRSTNNSLDPTYRLGCQDCKGALHKTTGHQKCTRDTNSSTASQKTPQPLDSVCNTVIARTTNLYKTNGKREFDTRQTEPGTTVNHQDQFACHKKAAKTSFNTKTKID